MRVVVVTTSYPRHAGDAAGAFLHDAVEALRTRGVHVDVVSPATVNHYGIAYGAGILGNLRRAPWKAALAPLFLASLARATRRTARGADIVHAHWLPTGVAARAAGKPYVLQLHGTDVELARAARLFRPVVRAARLAIAPSAALAEAARGLGAREVELIPEGVPIPAAVDPPDEPPHALFVGRLVEEKGVLELVEATRGLPLVVVGDGPLRDRVPGALGFVPLRGRHLSPARRRGRLPIAARGLRHSRAASPRVWSSGRRHAGRRVAGGRRRRENRAARPPA